MPRFLSNGLTLSLSLLTCLVLAEGAIRLVDGLPLTDIDLPAAYSDIGRDTTMQHLDKVPLAKGVARDWFFIDPPPLPNRRAVPEQWLALDRQMDARLRAGSPRSAGRSPSGRRTGSPPPASGYARGRPPA